MTLFTLVLVFLYHGHHVQYAIGPFPTLKACVEADLKVAAAYKANPHVPAPLVDGYCEWKQQIGR